jgi:hypothetical protein
MAAAIAASNLFENVRKSIIENGKTWLLKDI